MRFIEDLSVNQSSGRLVSWTALGVDSNGALLAFSIDIDNNRRVITNDATGAHVFSDRPLNTTFDTLTPSFAGANGQIGGTYLDAATGKFKSFLSQGASLQPFTLSGWTTATPRAVNTLGWIAGSGVHNGKTAGFLVRSGNVTDLGAFFPVLINTVGNLVSATGEVWIGNHSYQIPALPGGGAISPLGLNNLGAVVGTQNGQAFVWTPTGGTQNVTLLLQGSDALWQISAARGINDLGMIAADGEWPGVIALHAVLLTPTRVAAAGSWP